LLSLFTLETRLVLPGHFSRSFYGLQISNGSVPLSQRGPSATIGGVVYHPEFTMTSSDQADSMATPKTDPSSTPVNPAAEPTATDVQETTVTREQADQIISELKSIKQNIFWLLLVAGFFAARSFFFHY
jgi:hypothetical protein